MNVVGLSTRCTLQGYANPFQMQTEPLARYARTKTWGSLVYLCSIQKHMNFTWMFFVSPSNHPWIWYSYFKLCCLSFPGKTRFLLLRPRRRSFPRWWSRTFTAREPPVSRWAALRPLAGGAVRCPTRVRKQVLCPGNDARPFPHELCWW